MGDLMPRSFLMLQSALAECILEKKGVNTLILCSQESRTHNFFKNLIRVWT